jgi:3-methylcrotonyl-CoA carboxylase alpha subunit
MKRSLPLRFKGHTRQAAVGNDGNVHVGDSVFRIVPAADGAWHVTEPSGATRLVHVASSREGHWVHVDGNVYWIEAGHAERAGGYAADAVGGLTAPMPATVLSIVAPAGTHVAEGEVVLILEAMKMELPIRAPQSGTVTAIHCSEGQLVQPGIPLVEIA